MTETDTVTLTRSEYQALIARTEELEDALAAREADDGSRIPHEVALAIMGGEGPVLAFRRHLGMTLRELAARTGIAVRLPVRDRARTETGICRGTVQNRRNVRDHD